MVQMVRPQGRWQGLRMHPDLDDNKNATGDSRLQKQKKNKRCKDPDMTKASCLQAVGGNNCEGYDDDDSVEESENGGESGESHIESLGRWNQYYC